MMDYEPTPPMTNLERLRGVEKRMLKLENETLLLRRIIDLQTPLVTWALSELNHQQALRNEIDERIGA